MIRILVSACLLGAPVRYDGRDKLYTHPVLARWLAEGRVISTCPELLGGLTTPRPPAEIAKDRVITNEGHDVTREFEAGAHAAFTQAASEAVRVAVLKEGSPSCGTSFIYDGTFSGTRVEGMGVTASLLREHGIAVFSEEQLDAAAEYVAQLEAAL